MRILSGVSVHSSQAPLWPLRKQRQDQLRSDHEGVSLTAACANGVACAPIKTTKLIGMRVR